ncbi:MAG: M23 family metallopeptidase [Planctomycetota bacterium]|nr:MAG: M23 family metallopeptidase [Planctomycetota bacterium]
MVQVIIRTAVIVLPERRGMKRIVFLTALLVSLLCVCPASSGPKKVVYYLPLEYGDSRDIWQGNNDDVSHNDQWNRYAFDFWPMPVGTPIAAVADGVVTHVKEDTAGPTGNWEDNNIVAIRHADGNVSEYLHVRQNGAVVEKGQKVMRGDLIAYSGHTGKSTAPHLHFGLRLGSHETGKSVPIKFADVEGDGVPEKDDTVTSGNFPIRYRMEYDRINETAALYELCNDLGCLETVVKELKAFGKIEIPMPLAVLKGAIKKRDDILAEYGKAAENALEAIKKADADGDMKTAVRLACFGEKDFALSKKVADIRKLHAELRKKEGYKDASAALKDELGYRAKISRAIKSEIKADAKKKKSSKVSYKSVIKNYEKALGAAPEGTASEKLKKHIEELKARD